MHWTKQKDSSLVRLREQCRFIFSLSIAYQYSLCCANVSKINLHMFMSMYLRNVNLSEKNISHFFIFDKKINAIDF